MEGRRLIGGKNEKEGGVGGEKGDRGEKGVDTHVNEIIASYTPNEVTNFPMPTIDFPVKRVVVILSDQVVDDYFVTAEGNSSHILVLLT